MEIRRYLPTITTTLDNVRGGAQALEMVGGSNYYQTSQTFTATEGTSYTISGWIKTDNIPTGKAKIHLEWYDTDGHKIGSTVAIGSNVTDPNDPNANAYTQISKIKTSPEGTVSGKVILRLEGGTTDGTAWYDDVYVKLHPEPVWCRPSRKSNRTNDRYRLNQKCIFDDGTIAQFDLESLFKKAVELDRGCARRPPVPLDALANGCRMAFRVRGVSLCRRRTVRPEASHAAPALHRVWPAGASPPIPGWPH